MNKNCPKAYNPWLHYFAIATAFVTFLLLGLGGLVTSHEAGMSVPDWPNTYGYNMFLFPIDKWVGGVFYEHTHRLLASAVGLLTVVLAAWFWVSEPRAWVRRLGLVAVFLVIVQGVLGGLRVRWHLDYLGVFHGTVAQVFFILVCFFALGTSRWWLVLGYGKPLVPVSTGLRTLFVVTTGLIFLQLMLGATMRHQHAGLAIRDFPLAYGQLWPDTSATAVERYNADRIEFRPENPITAFQILLQMFHRVAALLIFVAVGLCAWQAWRQLGRQDLLARLGAAWFFMILMQVGLGIETLHCNKAADIATLHVMVGALSLVTGALWCIIAFRRDQALLILSPERPIFGGLNPSLAVAGNK